MAGTNSAPYEPDAEYIAEYLAEEVNEGEEFSTNDIRMFLDAKSGRAPTRSINLMLCDLGAKGYFDLLNGSGSYTWKAKVSVDGTEDKKWIEQELNSDLKDEYPQNPVSVKKKRKAKS